MTKEKHRIIFLVTYGLIQPKGKMFELISHYHQEKALGVDRDLRFQMNSLSTIFQALFKKMFLGELEIVALLHEYSLPWEIPLRRFMAARTCPALGRNKVKSFAT